ncbi:Alpha/Beta hydrolase protein [Hypoxylon cercidicola]|nr:Alpha/Beta hydrolase protein [Hypoxylon cercidicola]
MPGDEVYMDLITNVISKAESKVAVFFLQYDISAQAKYPRQFEQGCAAVRYLTADLGKSYSQLLLVGDSAGANLALAVLSHMSHPHPTVSTLQGSGHNFKGVLLISPWVTFDQTAPSFKTNAQKDFVSVPLLKSMSEAFMGDAPRSNYNTPLDAPPDWWRDIRTEKVLILAGGDEILKDDIQEFGEKLKKYNGKKVEVVVSPGECHDPPIAERLMRINGDPGLVEMKLYQWVQDQV